MEKKDFARVQSDKMNFCSTPLKRDIIADRDLIFVSEPIWKLLVERYRASDEICRYAIEKNAAGILDRSPLLPMVNLCLVLRDESIRSPKHIVVPRKTRFRDLKGLVRDVFKWLREL